MHMQRYIVAINTSSSVHYTAHERTETTDGAAYSVSETTNAAAATARKRRLKEVEALLLLPVKTPVLHLFDVQHCEHNYNTGRQQSVWP